MVARKRKKWNDFIISDLSNWASGIATIDKDLRGKNKIGGGNQKFFVWLLIQVERPNEFRSIQPGIYGRC